jgi:LytS/YehU family sensor histidine kinase
MLVQTLVENAVKHGISHLPAGGAVRVRATRESDSLLLKVENTGGIRPPDLNGSQVGLANARERLRLCCGERATLDLSGQNNTVTATVVIPGSA